VELRTARQREVTGRDQRDGSGLTLVCRDNVSVEVDGDRLARLIEARHRSATNTSVLTEKFVAD
jgi:hypothetical protein